MEWIINIAIFYGVAFFIWPKKYKPVHMIWAVPVFYLGLVVVGLVSGAVLQ